MGCPKDIWIKKKTSEKILEKVYNEFSLGK